MLMILVLFKMEIPSEYIASGIKENNINKMHLKFSDIKC